MWSALQERRWGSSTFSCTGRREECVCVCVRVEMEGEQRKAIPFKNHQLTHLQLPDPYLIWNKQKVCLILPSKETKEFRQKQTNKQTKVIIWGSEARIAIQIMKQPHTESSLQDSFLLIGRWIKLFRYVPGWVQYPKYIQDRERTFSRL